MPVAAVSTGTAESAATDLAAVSAGGGSSPSTWSAGLTAVASGAAGGSGCRPRCSVCSAAATSCGSTCAAVTSGARCAARAAVATVASGLTWRGPGPAVATVATGATVGVCATRAAGSTCATGDRCDRARSAVAAGTTAPAESLGRGGRPEPACLQQLARAQEEMPLGCLQACDRATAGAPTASHCRLGEVLPWLSALATGGSRLPGRDAIGAIATSAAAASPPPRRGLPAAATGGPDKVGAVAAPPTAAVPATATARSALTALTSGRPRRGA
jgi:hypothetical protein